MARFNEKKGCHRKLLLVQPTMYRHAVMLGDVVQGCEGKLLTLPSLHHYQTK